MTTVAKELEVLEALQERLERHTVQQSASTKLKYFISRLRSRWLQEQTADIESLLGEKELPELVYLVRTAFRAWSSREALDPLRPLEHLAHTLQIDLPETSAPPRYDDDFAAWAQHQASRICLGLWEEVDQEHVAEELEGLSRSEQHELEHRLEVLMAHLLKWQYRQQYPHAERGWRLTIVEQRRRLARLLHKSPSLSAWCPTVLADSYPHARLVTSIELDFPDDTTLPLPCPWTVAQVLDADFWPESSG